jgi:hypothetical protein
MQANVDALVALYVYSYLLPGVQRLCIGSLEIL